MFKKMTNWAVILLAFSYYQGFSLSPKTAEELDRPPETEEELRQLEREVAKNMVEHQQKLRARQPQYVTLADQISLEHVKLFTQYIDGKLFGFGGGFFEKVNYLNLTFTAKMSAPVDIKRARQLLILGSQDLLYRINQSQEIRPFLKNYPFDSTNLSYGFLFMNKQGEVYVNPAHHQDSGLTSCHINEGRISYWINYSPLKSECIYRESYEEALKIVSQERPDLLKPLTANAKVEL